jgi:ornithine decarboxylase
MMAMTPRAAMQAFIRNDIDYVPLSEISGRIAATLALVYPPGIGVMVPGERYGAKAQPMLDYLLMFEEAANRFPGFDSEIQGVFREATAEGEIRFFTYVVRES